MIGSGVRSRRGRRRRRAARAAERAQAAAADLPANAETIAAAGPQGLRWRDRLTTRGVSVTGLSSSPALAVFGVYATGHLNITLLVWLGSIQGVVVVGWVCRAAAKIVTYVPAIRRESSISTVVYAITRDSAPLDARDGVLVLGVLIPQAPDATAQGEEDP